MTVEIFDSEQGSPEWFEVRRGVVTASEFHCVLAQGKDKDGKKSRDASRMRRSYMLRLVGERLTGDPAETYSNGHMERGRMMEAEARTLYAFMEDQNPLPVGFIRNGDVGCSPDSLLSDVGVLEIKTKLPHLQIEALLFGQLPSEHKAQVQGQLWVAEREWCDFVSYWPRLPLFVHRVHREEPYIDMLAREVRAFIEETREVEKRIRQMETGASTMADLQASAILMMP